MSDFDVEFRVDSHDMDLILGRLTQSLTEERIAVFMEEEAMSYLHERISQRFAHEGDDIVGPWAPLRFSTEKVRGDAGFGAAHPINERTGELRNWLIASHTVTESGDGVIGDIPGNASIGLELMDKLTTAQIGRSDPSTVARPVLGIGVVDMEAIVTSMRMWIVESIAT